MAGSLGGWWGGSSAAMEQNLRSPHTHFIRVIEINLINYAPLNHPVPLSLHNPLHVACRFGS